MKNPDKLPLPTAVRRTLRIIIALAAAGAAAFLGWYLVNPMASILTIWRNIFYSPKLEMGLFWKPLLISGAIFLLGRMVFRKLQPIFAERM